jgi:acetyltransferase-like isoleucine patch superfamily enzyme
MIGSVLTRMRQRKSPLFLALKRVVHGVRTLRLPLPDFLRPVLRLLFYTQQSLLNVIRWLLAVLIYEPLFRGRCSVVGKRLRVTRMPYVIGPTSIHIGDDVNFFGKVDIASGYVCQNPKLILHDRVDLGHNILFVVNKLIEIESDVNVAGDVRFMDTDAHPRDMAARIADLPPGEEEVKPVRICRGAWIGQNAAILKGVTVGEGAIIGINSVVVTDVPPHTVAMGNPARVVVKNVPRTPS